jgi:CDP-glucose 4,6-dehydratase
MALKGGFWEDKRVLLTGGSGFIGSHIAEKLVSEGAELTILMKDDCPIGMAGLAAIGSTASIVRGDLLDAELIDRICPDKDVILHLAAITQVIYSVKNPKNTVEVDVNGTLNILEAIRRKNDSAFLIFTSTDKVYGESAYVPVDESHPLSAKSPYDASKLAADRLVNAYQTTYGIKGSISRCSNVLGGRDANILRALPGFVYPLMRGRDPVIRSNGKLIRDYMHVDDAVRGILSLAEKQDKSSGLAFNFGTGKPTSVIRLAELVVKAFGDTSRKPVVRGMDAKVEIENQYLSYRLAKERLGWEPKVRIEEAVERSVRWYKENPGWLDVMENVARYYGIGIDGG